MRRPGSGVRRPAAGVRGLASGVRLSHDSEGTIMAFTLEGIDHVAIAVRDVKASAQWFQDVLGLKRLHEAAWGDYPAMVGIGTTALALFPVEGVSPEPPPGRHVLAMRHLAFRADAENYARAQRELTRRGIAFESQDHGISTSIYFHDPNGHEIEITTYELGEGRQ